MESFKIVPDTMSELIAAIETEKSKNRLEKDFKFLRKLENALERLMGNGEDTESVLSPPPPPEEAELVLSTPFPCETKADIVAAMEKERAKPYMQKDFAYLAMLQKQMETRVEPPEQSRAAESQFPRQTGALPYNRPIYNLHCKYWLRGHCGHGTSCKYIHDPSLCGTAQRQIPAYHAVEETCTKDQYGNVVYAQQKTVNRLHNGMTTTTTRTFTTNPTQMTGPRRY